jgi:uncharacterized protein (TIGR03067 family)
MRFRLLALPAIFAILLATSVNAQDANDPGKALYGEWEIVEMIYKGKVQDFGLGRNGGWFLFEPGGFIRSRDEEQRRQLDNPGMKKLVTNRCFIGRREIDILLNASRMDAQWIFGIYELKDGVLRIVLANEAGPRPTRFDALNDDRLILYVLKKVK